MNPLDAAEQTLTVMDEVRLTTMLLFVVCAVLLLMGVMVYVFWRERVAWMTQTAAAVNAQTGQVMHMDTTLGGLREEWARRDMDQMQMQARFGVNIESLTASVLSLSRLTDLMLVRWTEGETEAAAQRAQDAQTQEARHKALLDSMQTTRVDLKTDIDGIKREFGQIVAESKRAREELSTQAQTDLTLARQHGQALLNDLRAAQKEITEWLWSTKGMQHETASKSDGGVVGGAVAGGGAASNGDSGAGGGGAASTGTGDVRNGDAAGSGTTGGAAAG